MSETVLQERDGPIWATRPSVTSTGLLSIVWNRKHRRTSTSTPLFRDVAFAPSGLSLATVDARGHLVHFNLLHNRYYHVKHAGAPGTKLAYLPLKRDEVVVALEDGSIQCFCLSTGELLGSLNGHKHAVHSLTFDSTGRLLMTASVDAAVIWRISDWTRVRTLGAGAGITQAGFLPDADAIGCIFRDNSVLVWDSISYAVKARLQPPDPTSTTAVSCFAASANGAHFIAGTRGGSILVWDLATQVLTRVIDMPQPTCVVIQLLFLPDNVTAAVLCDDGHVVILSVAASTCKAVLDVSAPDRAIVRFAVDPTGRYLASLVSDGRLMIHDMEAARKFRGRVRSTHERMGLNIDEEDGANPALAYFARASRRSKSPVVTTFRTTLADQRDELARKSTSHTVQRTAEASKAVHKSRRAVERSLIDDPADDAVGKSDSDNVSSSQPEDGSDGEDTSTAGLVHGTSRVKVIDSIPNRVESGRRQTSKLIEKVFPSLRASAVAEKAGVPASSKQSSRDFASASVPLYRLSVQSAHDVTINDERLTSLLLEYGKFPAKYRCLIWRFLLRLPDNHVAYEDLASGGVHPAYSNLHAQYPLKDSRLFRRLRRCLSVLAFWSPVMGELPFLPELAFPFVKVFGGDAVGACEAVMTVLLNWCGSWAEMFPYPPLSELGRVKSLLEFHDAQLADHLLACGAGPDVFAWPMLRTLLSEVLPREDWCQLWDNLITNADDPSLLLFAVVAFLIANRVSLFAVVPSVSESDTSSRDEIESFLRRQSPVNMSQLLQRMYALRKASPSFLVKRDGSSEHVKGLPGASLGSRVFGEGGISNFPGDAPVGSPTDVAACKLAGKGPAYALPVGGYPPFTRFPKFIVDFQLQERQRLVAEEESLRSRKSIAETLAARNAELAAQERAWKEETDLLIAAEQARMKAAKQLDAEHARAVDTLAAEAREQRMRKLVELQEAHKLAMSSQHALATAESSRALESEQRWQAMRNRMARELDEEQQLQSAELTVGQRVREDQAVRVQEHALTEALRAESLRAEADRLTSLLEQQKAAAELESKAVAALLEQDRMHTFEKEMAKVRAEATQKANEESVGLRAAVPSAPAPPPSLGVPNHSGFVRTPHAVTQSPVKQPTSDVAATIRELASPPVVRRPPTSAGKQSLVPSATVSQKLALSTVTASDARISPQVSELPSRQAPPAGSVPSPQLPQAAAQSSATTVAIVSGHSQRISELHTERDHTSRDVSFQLDTVSGRQSLPGQVPASSAATHPTVPTLGITTVATVDLGAVGRSVDAPTYERASTERQQPDQTKPEARFHRTTTGETVEPSPERGTLQPVAPSSLPAFALPSRFVSSDVASSVRYTPTASAASTTGVRPTMVHTDTRSSVPAPADARAFVSEFTAPHRSLQGPSYADILAGSNELTGSERILGESKSEAGTPFFPQRIRGNFPDYSETEGVSSHHESVLRGSAYRSTTSYSAEMSGSGYWTTDDGSQHPQPVEGFLDSRVRFRPNLQSYDYTGGTSGSSHTYDASGSGYWSTE